MAGTKKRRSKATRGGDLATAPEEKERTWVAIPDPAPGVTEPIYVSFPAPPDEEAIAEAANYLQSLEARQQIARGPQKPTSATTHRIEVDREGRRCLVRLGFS